VCGERVHSVTQSTFAVLFSPQAEKKKKTVAFKDFDVDHSTQIRGVCVVCTLKAR